MNMRKRSKILFFVVALLFFTGCKEQILHNLLESEVNRYRTKLHEANIEANKVKQPDGRWALEVSTKDAVSAIKYLNDSRLLKEQSIALDKTTVISSREDQRFRYERNLSRELESTLSSVDGVLETRVHLNLPPVDPLFGRPIGESRGSASVLLVIKEGADVTKTDVSSLVAGAAGMPTEAVSVLISQASSQVDRLKEEGGEPSKEGREEAKKHSENIDAQKTISFGQEYETQNNILSLWSWFQAHKESIQLSVGILLLLIGSVLGYQVFFRKSMSFSENRMT